MSTAIQLKVPWWARFKWPKATGASPERTLNPPLSAAMNADMADLDARTLRDIGAPDSMLARAHARRQNEQQERDNLRFGLVSGGGAWWRRGF